MSIYYGKKITYPDGSGSYIIYSKPRSTFESLDVPKKPKTSEIDEMDFLSEYSEYDSVQRATRRARAKIRDYIRCNDFTHFVTLTFDPKKYPDNESREKRLKKYFDYQREKNPEFQYVIVPELHKSGLLHYHGVLKIPKNDLIEAKNNDVGIFHAGQQVYNLKSWSRTGFSTATKIKDKNKVASYSTKYITKKMVKEKKNKKTYWCSKGLKGPEETMIKKIPNLDGSPAWENDFVKIYNF